MFSQCLQTSSGIGQPLLLLCNKLTEHKGKGILLVAEENKIGAEKCIRKIKGRINFLKNIVCIEEKIKILETLSLRLLVSLKEGECKKKQRLQESMKRNWLSIGDLHF